MISRAQNGSKPDREVRVAVYCRKSVADKTGQEFGSIDAQREAIEAYVASQRSDGWTAIPHRYDDDGFSGATTKRPAFERLLADIDDGHIDAVAVHRIDRLSRSLADFATLMRSFEDRGIAFISIQQQFDTTTSMGKLTLNILASFAEFEREMISERTREKMLATRQRGSWTGGTRPVGYKIVDRKLVIDEDEAKLVREAFDTFLETKKLITTARIMNDKGIRTPRGSKIERGFLRRLFRSPVYAGRIRAGDEIVEATHDAIVDETTWDRAQEILDSMQRPQQAKRPSGRLLAGLLRCGRCGGAMLATSTTKANRRYAYYTCARMAEHGAAKCPNARANAAEVERVVFEKIREIGENHELLAAAAEATRAEKAIRIEDLRKQLADLERKRATLIRQQTRLVEEASRKNSDARPLHETLGRIMLQLNEVDRETATVTTEITALEASDLPDDEIREAIGAFDEVWAELFPPERVRIAKLLIDRVNYHPHGGELEIVLRDEAIEVVGATKITD